MRRIPYLIPALVLGLPLGFVILWGSGSLYQRVSPGMAQAATLGSARVRVETLAPAPLAHVIALDGTVQPTASAVLGSKLLATLTALHVKEGDRVSQGALLATLDARDLDAQAARARAGLSEAGQGEAAADAAIAQAEAQFELAEKTRRRIAALHADGSASDQDWNEAESRYRVAQAALAQAREQGSASRSRLAEAQSGLGLALTNASYAELRAPFDGLVTKKWLDAGTLATPGAPVLQVDRLPFRLELPVDERLAASLRPGADVPVTLDALGATLDGHLSEVLPSVDPVSRTALVRVQLPDDPRLRPGMDGRARFALGESKRLSIPEAAVVHWYHLTSAFVVGAHNRASLRFVRLGAAEGDRVEVLAGLQAGDRVVVDGLNGLRDGMSVEITP